MRGSLLKTFGLLMLAVLLLSTTSFAAEFIVNGSLSRALTGGSRCETSTNAFCCWTLTPENGGGTNYSADEFWPDTRLCGCSGVPCQIYPSITQTFGISGGGAYTLTWEQRNDQEDCTSRTTMWSAMTSIGTVYYYKDAAMLQPCSVASEDTGNVTGTSRGVWASIVNSSTSHAPLHGTAPADCRYIKVVIKALSKTNTCTDSGTNIHAWTEIRNVSLASTAFTKTSGPEPFITQQPANKTVTAGDQITFTITATGPGTKTYQWQKKIGAGSFIDISGANSTSYTTPALTANDSGNQYRCKVSNTCIAVYSNAAVLTVYAPVVVSSIYEGKTYADSTLIKLTDKVVSARTDYAYWIQDSNPPCGIRVNSALYPVPGTKVTVTGNLLTGANERMIQPVIENMGAVGELVKPYYIATGSLGGSELNEYTPGIPGAFGPNNIGMFVRVCGSVTAIGNNYYYIDDGINLKDGTSTSSVDNLGVRVIGPTGNVVVNTGVAVTGISSTFLNGSSRPQRAIILPGCTSPDSGLAVGAAASSLCSGQSTTITVASSEVGIVYQLRNNANNSNVGSPVSGTGLTLSFPTGNLTSTTTYNVLATRTVGGCSTQLAQTKTITVNQLPTAGLTVSAQQTQLDAGQSTNVTVASSQIGVNYQLRKNTDNSSVGSPVAGTGGTIFLPTGTFASNGIYPFNVFATNVSGCTQQLTQTVTITVGNLGTLAGKVMNALAQPISGAVVTLSSGGYSTTTNASGNYTMANVPAGTYSLSASANTYQTHTWDNVTVTANTTKTVWGYYLPHSWSKLGWHIVNCNISENLPNGQWGMDRFFDTIQNCGKTCQMAKGCNDFCGTFQAAEHNPGSFRIGRRIDLNNYGEIQGYDEQWAAGKSPSQVAAQVYAAYKPYMQANPSVHVWEVTNEWNSHYDWQADFFIAMMDLAELDGFRLALFSSSFGTPSYDPNYYFPGDTRPVIVNVARACARAKAHGGHMLALHEYAPEDTLYDFWHANGSDIVLRYRKIHDYLKTYNDPSKGYVGADCPIIITECAGELDNDQAMLNDWAWYDSEVRKDSYLLGVAIWNIGRGVEMNVSTAFDDLANYICTH